MPDRPPLPYDFHPAVPSFELRSDGEMFPPVMPNPSKTWFSPIWTPSATSSLLSSNEGTGGMKS